jgi:hypothetical protein
MGPLRVASAALMVGLHMYHGMCTGYMEYDPQRGGLQSPEESRAEEEGQERHERRNKKKKRRK